VGLPGGGVNKCDYRLQLLCVSASRWWERLFERLRLLGGLIQHRVCCSTRNPNGLAKLSMYKASPAAVGLTGGELSKQTVSGLWDWEVERVTGVAAAAAAAANLRTPGGAAGGAMCLLDRCCVMFELWWLCLEACTPGGR
jgi:hypothetical protein